MRSLLFALMLIAMTTATWAEPTTQPTNIEVKVGDVPQLTFTPLGTDKPISLSDYRGKPLLVEFSATWCPLCMDQFKKLTALNDQYKDALGIIWVSLDRDEARLQRVIKGKRINFPVHFEGKAWDNSVYTSWYAGRNEGIPRSYLIGADGCVAFTTFSHEGLEQAVADEMAKAKSQVSADTVND